MRQTIRFSQRRPTHLRVAAAEPTPGDSTRSSTSATLRRLAIPGSLLLGVLIRASFVLSADFPLNDGGLFFAMARDLQTAGYALPETTSYNLQGIPFAYPPLPFYFAALLDDVSPMSLVTVFRFLPAVMSSLALIAFWLLARRILRPGAVATAVTAFALLPASFLWMIMGGGITRATGYFFAFLCLHQVHRMFTERRLSLAVPAGILAGLTLLSHLEMASFVAFSSALFFAAYSRDARGIAASLLVAVLALSIAAPWWASVLVYHGPSPFVEAALSGSGGALRVVVQLIEFDFTVEPLFAIIGALSLAGVVVCLGQRQYLLPLWLVAAGLLDPRAFPASAAAPAAMLAAIGLHDLVLPYLQHAARWRPSSLLVRSRGASPDPGVVPLQRGHAWTASALISVILFYSVFSALLASPKVITAMSSDERDAMAWVASNTPDTSAVAVVSGDAWAVDRTSEWFPVLAQRKSIATVQGYEWVAGGGFRKQQKLYNELQDCAVRDSDCLAAWQAEFGAQFDYVYIPHLVPRVPKTETEVCCEPLIESLTEDPGYSLVYEGAGASIFEKLD